MTQQHYAPPAAPAGGPQPSRQGSSLLPWLVAAVVLLVAAAGVIAYLLLRSADDGADTDTSTGDAAALTQAGAKQPGDIDGDPVVSPEGDGEQPPADEGTPYNGDGGTVPGSVDRAAVFMDDVVLGDFIDAVGHGSADFQDRYGPDAAQIGMDIAAIDGALPVNYRIDAVQSDEARGGDVVVLTVELPDGTYNGLDVIVGEEDGRAVVLRFE